MQAVDRATIAIVDRSEIPRGMHPDRNRDHSHMHGRRHQQQVASTDQNVHIGSAERAFCPPVHHTDPAFNSASLWPPPQPHMHVGMQLERQDRVGQVARPQRHYKHDPKGTTGMPQRHHQMLSEPPWAHPPPTTSPPLLGGGLHIPPQPGPAPCNPVQPPPVQPLDTGSSSVDLVAQCLSHMHAPSGPPSLHTLPHRMHQRSRTIPTAQMHGAHAPSPHPTVHSDIAGPPSIGPDTIAYQRRYDATSTPLCPPVASTSEAFTSGIGSFIKNSQITSTTTNNITPSDSTSSAQPNASLLPNWCVVTGLPSATLPPTVRPGSPVSIMHLLPWALGLRKYVRMGAVAVVLDPTVRQVRGDVEQPALTLTVTPCGDSQAVVTGITHRDMYMGRQNLPEAWRMPEQWGLDTSPLRLGDLDGVRLVLSHEGLSLLCKPSEAVFLTVQSSLNVLRQALSNKLSGSDREEAAALLTAIIHTCMDILGITHDQLPPLRRGALGTPGPGALEQGGPLGANLRGTCLQRLNHSKQKLALSVEWHDWQRPDLRWVSTLIVNGKPITRGDACWKKQDSREHAACTFFSHLDGVAAAAADGL